jgi:hypothetical protein
MRKGLHQTVKLYRKEQVRTHRHDSKTASTQAGADC